jgi:hypothetical protein
MSLPASLDRLLRGEGDVASIDCVTYAFWRHYRPETAARVQSHTRGSRKRPYAVALKDGGLMALAGL